MNLITSYSTEPSRDEGCQSFPFDLTGLLRGCGTIFDYKLACSRAIDGRPGEVRAGLESSRTLLDLYPNRIFVARIASPGEITACGDTAQYWRGALVVIGRIRPGDTVIYGDGGQWVSCQHFVQVLIPWSDWSRDCYDKNTRVLALQYEHFARNAFLIALSIAESADHPVLACSGPVAVTPDGLAHAWVVA
ncbi:MAG: hypothetical protein K2Q28_04835 [Hyphomicrobium sp.]|nr:hypothetical protein [Hyphomicrobium sp.]